LPGVLNQCVGAQISPTTELNVSLGNRNPNLRGDHMRSRRQCWSPWPASGWAAKPPLVCSGQTTTDGLGPARYGSANWLIDWLTTVGLSAITQRPSSRQKPLTLWSTPAESSGLTARSRVDCYNPKRGSRSD